MDQRSDFSYATYTKVYGLREMEEGRRAIQRRKDCFCERLYGKEGWRPRYIRAASWLWSLAAGVMTGVLLATYTFNRKFEIVLISTVLYFVASICATGFNNSNLVSRLSLFTGLVWLSTAWYEYMLREFGDDMDNYFNATLVVSILWGCLVFLPIALTDPVFKSCYTPTVQPGTRRQPRV